MNKKDVSFFAKPFSEKRFVNISICQSNIKSKKGTYYGKVCKMGHLNTKQILQIAKDRSPHINIPLIESALETIADVILDMAGQGYSVEFANLGTFSISTQGKIEMSEELAHKEPIEKVIDNSIQDSIENSEDDIEDLIDELQKDSEVAGNYDVSGKVKKEVNFTFKFSPSKTLKASMKNIKMNLAIKKHRAPKIEKIENVLPPTSKKSPAILKIRGDGLKVIGERKEVGIYIEEKNLEKNEPNMMKNQMDRLIKVPLTSIIQNENRTLTFLLEERLKQGATYSITLITQGVSGGKLGKKLKFAKSQFVWETEKIDENKQTFLNIAFIPTN